MTRNRFLLRLGQIALLTAPFWLCFPVWSAENPDIPHDGDSMAVVDAGPDAAVAVDVKTVRNEADGSRTAVVLMVSKDGATAGRLAFECKSREYRIVSLFKLEKGHEAARVGGAMPYEFIPSGSVVDEVAQFVCSQNLKDTST